MTWLNMVRRGTANGAARLDPATVGAIRQALAQGESIRRLAKRYGVSRMAIYHIREGRNWGWLMTT